MRRYNLHDAHDYSYFPFFLLEVDIFREKKLVAKLGASKISMAELRVLLDESNNETRLFPLSLLMPPPLPLAALYFLDCGSEGIKNGLSRKLGERGFISSTKLNTKGTTLAERYNRAELDLQRPYNNDPAVEYFFQSLLGFTNQIIGMICLKTCKDMYPVTSAWASRVAPLRFAPGPSLLLLL